jgi:hypothetical protein
MLIEAFLTGTVVVVGGVVVVVVRGGEVVVVDRGKVVVVGRGDVVVVGRGAEVVVGVVAVEPCVVVVPGAGLAAVVVVAADDPPFDPPEPREIFCRPPAPCPRAVVVLACDDPPPGRPLPGDEVELDVPALLSGDAEWPLAPQPAITSAAAPSAMIHGCQTRPPR